MGGTTTRCCLRHDSSAIRRSPAVCRTTSTPHTASRSRLITRSARGRVSDCSAHRAGAPSIFATQPGPRQPDGFRAQAALLEPARLHGIQGDRGGLPVRIRNRFRLHPHAHRARAHPGRCDYRGAHPVPRAPHPPHLRGAEGCQARHRALLQLRVRAAARSGVQEEQGRDQEARHRRRRTMQGPRIRGQGHRPVLRVLAGILHRNRAGVRR